MTDQTQFDPFDDPWGHADALQQAVSRWYERVCSFEQSSLEALAAWAVRCFGRCRLYSIAIKEQLAHEIMESGLHCLCGQIESARDDAETLGERWYATDNPWEADGLCLNLLRLRTDLLGIQLAFSDSVGPKSEIGKQIENFDSALRAAKDTLSTVIDATEYETLQSDVGASLGAVQLPWWLGGELADAAQQNEAEAEQSSPSKEIVSAAGRLQTWRRILPPEILPAILATAIAEERATYETLSLVWEKSESAELRAELLLPSLSSSTSERELRRLSFWKQTTTGRERARELAGYSVRIGAFSGALDLNAEARLTVRDLREGCDGQMFVGDDPIPWKPRRDLPGIDGIRARSDNWKFPTIASSTFARTNEARFANQRKSLTENSLRIAAAAAGEVESAFLHIVYKIDGDSLVAIRLHERPIADGKLELVVALLGATPEIRKYSSVEIEFDLESTALTRNAKFELEDAIIEIGADEAKAKIRSIILTDMSNNQRRVIEG